MPQISICATYPVNLQFSVTYFTKIRDNLNECDFGLVFRHNNIPDGSIMNIAKHDNLDWATVIKKELDKLNDYIAVDADQHWKLFVQNLSTGA